MNKKHCRENSQLKKKFGGPIKRNLLSEWIKFFKRSPKFYPGLTLLSFFLEV